MTTREHKSTLRVDLPGRQNRLRQMILYIAQKCEGAEHFGAVKLNKILWKSDFDAYAARRRPVTGRPYQRLRLGPAPKEMVPVRDRMVESGEIRFEMIDYGDDVIEHRTIALVDPDLRIFSDEDLSFVNQAIEHYWDMTGRETSDESHGLAWRTRDNGDPMPYETAMLSDKPLGQAQLNRLRRMVHDRGLMSE
jgi:hypothetical protein